MANNSSGARSVLYGKTIDHVIEQHVVLSDGSVVQLRPIARAPRWTTSAGATRSRAACYSEVRRLARDSRRRNRPAIPEDPSPRGRLQPRRVRRPGRAVQSGQLIVGSEGTLGVVLEAKIALVPLPKAKAVMAIQFADLLRGARGHAADSAHGPSAIEVMDGFILDNTKQSPALDRMRRTFIEGDPGGAPLRRVLRRRRRDLPPRLDALERDLVRARIRLPLSSARWTWRRRRRSGACARPRSVSRWR